jgi:hypothetical protein
MKKQDVELQKRIRHRAKVIKDLHKTIPILEALQVRVKQAERKANFDLERTRKAVKEDLKEYWDYLVLLEKVNKGEKKQLNKILKK